jgi:hypothetical protein
MRKIFYQNFEIFQRGNLEGVQAFEQYLNSGTQGNAQETRRLFYDAVRYIFPGQRITIPKP